MYRVFNYLNDGFLERDWGAHLLKWSSEEAEGHEPMTSTADKPQKAWGS